MSKTVGQQAYDYLIDSLKERGEHFSVYDIDDGRHIAPNESFYSILEGMLHKFAVDVTKNDSDEPERIYVGGAPKDVNKALHYNCGKIECIDFLEDQGLGFHEANALKYVVRARHKGTEIKDLEKAIWYLHRKLLLLKDSKVEVENGP